jgi:predicted nucleic acid-binding protein
VAVTAVLDTNVILYMLSGRIADAPSPGRFIVSVISVLELLSFPTLGPEEENRIRAFLSAIEVVELTPEVQAATIALRRAHGLKLPDAIIAATAVAFKADLMTNDRRLSNLPNVPTAQIRLRAE